jgi:hypothetical protein
VLEKLRRSGLPSLRGDGGGISVAEFQGDIDFGMRLIFDFLEMFLPQLLKKLVSLNDEVGKRVGT